MYALGDMTARSTYCKVIRMKATLIFSNMTPGMIATMPRMIVVIRDPSLRPPNRLDAFQPVGGLHVALHSLPPLVVKSPLCFAEDMTFDGLRRPLLAIVRVTSAPRFKSRQIDGETLCCDASRDGGGRTRLRLC